MCGDSRALSPSPATTALVGPVRPQHGTTGIIARDDGQSAAQSSGIGTAVVTKRLGLPAERLRVTLDRVGGDTYGESV